MKTYVCDKCGSIGLFLEEKVTHTGLYCGDCGTWIKWVGKKEIPLVKRFLAANK